jgi:hypothetical protein
MPTRLDKNQLCCDTSVATFREVSRCSHLSTGDELFRTLHFQHAVRNSRRCTLLQSKMARYDQVPLLIHPTVENLRGFRERDNTRADSSALNSLPLIPITSSLAKRSLASCTTNRAKHHGGKSQAALPLIVAFCFSLLQRQTSHSECRSHWQILSCQVKPRQYEPNHTLQRISVAHSLLLLPEIKTPIMFSVTYTNRREQTFRSRSRHFGSAASDDPGVRANAWMGYQSTAEAGLGKHIASERWLAVSGAAQAGTGRMDHG